ncbi:MAG: epoxyqueuosine reductase [Chloroflexi bacterium]|nr:epoxyqueuosine reductase [Chloroflexota bacterium]
MSTAQTGLQEQIVDAIKGYVAESPGNRFVAIDGSPIFEEPLIGFADGDDPLFQQYKSVVGDFHLTPREAMGLHFADASDQQPDSPLSVISFVLPLTEETRRSNAEMTFGPSVRWNQTRWHGEDCIRDLKRFIVGFLQERGYRAMSPTLEPFFKMLVLSNGRASNWSERHVAYAAGLGTFGLTDALITAKGVAHRVGSLLAEVALEPTPRPYDNHHAYCPFYDDGSCGVCIERCPADALSENGHDKIRCRDYSELELKPWVAKQASAGYIGAYPGCGLCMAGVPCESAIPPGVKLG